MKLKKIISIFTCGLVLTSLLTGCGNSAGDSKDSASNNSKGKETHLKILIKQPNFKDQYSKYFDQFCAKYEKENGIKVTYDLEMPDSNNGNQILKTRLAAKEDLDIFDIHAVNDMATFNKAGYLENLNDQPFAGKLLDNVKPIVSVDNKVLGLPLESLAYGYLYNKKIFNDLGLKPPTTITEMKSVIEKLKAANINPFLISYKDSWIPQLFLPLTVGSYASTTNKDFITKMNDGTGSFKDISGMFDIIDLVNANGTSKGMDIGADDGCAAFVQGKAAMWVQGPWESESILKLDSKFEIGNAPLPINDDPKATLISTSVSTTLCVSKYSKNKEVSKALLNYILDDEVTNDFYQSMKFNQVAKNQTFTSYPWVDEALTYVKAGQSCQDPAIPQAVKDEVGKVLQTYYLKSSSKDDVINDLDKTWADALKNAK
jgi:ABC-type sugar transport system, periplasmic component